MSENKHESKVEMVISTVPKPVFMSVFWTFYSASVIQVPFFLFLMYLLEPNRGIHVPYPVGVRNSIIFSKLFSRNQIVSMVLALNN